MRGRHRRCPRDAGRGHPSGPSTAGKDHPHDHPGGGPRSAAVGIRRVALLLVAREPSLKLDSVRPKRVAVHEDAARRHEGARQDGEDGYEEYPHGGHPPPPAAAAIGPA